MRMSAKSRRNVATAAVWIAVLVTMGVLDAAGALDRRSAGLMILLGTGHTLFTRWNG